MLASLAGMALTLVLDSCRLLGRRWRHSLIFFSHYHKSRPNFHKLRSHRQKSRSHYCKSRNRTTANQNSDRKSKNKYVAYIWSLIFFYFDEFMIAIEEATNRDRTDTIRVRTVLKWLDTWKEYMFRITVGPLSSWLSVGSSLAPGWLCQT